MARYLGHRQRKQKATMRKLAWSDDAINDLVRVREFIAQENPDAAKRAAETIKETAKRLIQFPDIGKPVEELPEYRDFLIRFGAAGYVMRYRAHLDTIYIIHVKHYRESGFKT